VDGLTGLQTLQNNKGLGGALEQNAKRCSMSSALHRSHGSLRRALSQPCEALVLHFCSPNAGNCVALLQSLCT